MIRVPLSRHTLHPLAIVVDTNGADAVRLQVGDKPLSELTAGEARYLAEALNDAAGRIE